jgi:hypothetical protein
MMANGGQEVRQQSMTAIITRHYMFKMAPGEISGQGCQMVYFPTKNPNWDEFLRALVWKMLVFL